MGRFLGKDHDDTKQAQRRPLASPFPNSLNKHTSLRPSVINANDLPSCVPSAGVTCTIICLSGFRLGSHNKTLRESSESSSRSLASPRLPISRWPVVNTFAAAAFPATEGQAASGGGIQDRPLGSLVGGIQYLSQALSMPPHAFLS